MRTSAALPQRRCVYGHVPARQATRMLTYANVCGRLQHYPNGDVFTGMFLRDKRHGIGRLDLANNGGFYLGEWNDDCRSGKGSLTYGNKDMYVGAWARFG